MLDEVYIGEYYYAVPAFLACLCILAFIHSSRERAFFVVGLFFSAICAVIIVVQVLKPTTYQSIYNDRVGLEIYQKLEVVRSDSRIVLDLSVDQHWGYLWSAILGAEVVAARKGENLFCLNKGWHISFTKQAKCSAEEVKNNDRYLVKYLKSAEADTSPGSFSTRGSWDDRSLEGTGHIRAIFAEFRLVFIRIAVCLECWTGGGDIVACWQGFHRCSNA
jgi:hypothetical protein